MDAPSSAFRIILNDSNGEERVFTNTTSISEFFEQENIYWAEKAVELTEPKTVRGAADLYSGALGLLNTHLNTPEPTDEHAKTRWTQTLQRTMKNQLMNAVFSGTPFAEAWLDACGSGARQGQAFREFITGYRGNANMTEIAHPQGFEGAIRAYEFLNQDESRIGKRRDAEKHAFVRLRNDLAAKRDELVTAVEAFQHGINEWRDVTKKEMGEHLANDRARDEKFMAEAKNNLNELQDLYRRKLQLEAPAEYWRQRAKKYFKAGLGWGAGLVLSTLLSGGAFVYLLGQWMQGAAVLEKFSAQHWQGIVLLVGVLSMAAFLIRTFGKLTFSSFHLQRDAEEREQLSYLYLALAKEAKITDESLKIVLTSLFSRSDTGLLSGDHGPTMPGVADLIAKGK